MDADALLAARLQVEEREQFFIDEKARFLVETITERKREQKWINDFVPMDSEVVKDNEKKDDNSQKQAESTKKSPRAEHDEESVKKQKLEDDTEKEEDVLDLYRLVKKRYETISPESILLWGDLITLFELRNDLKDVEWKLEIDHKSEMAFELIKFIKAQLEE
uniref:Uncharacterized protein n=1 Tax=Tanacetum cinerariifolium TaxID=118510 RepID=A0A699I438_TANCI|nr:hypothetical protein [Tanacetum cinerariifolium]